MAARGRGLFSLHIYIENFKNLLVRNHQTDFNIILQKYSFGDPLPRLFKPSGFVKKHGRRGGGGGGLFSLYIYIENFKNLLVRNHQTDFNISLHKCFFGDPLPRLFKPFGFVKNMATRGRGFFSLYIYIENFKILLVRNHWTDFNITLQKCFFGDPLPRFFKPFVFVKKRGLFSLYIYIENFKNLLVRNHQTDFNISLHKCFFGDPLPRLFKPFGFVKNMATRGRGFFSLYIYIENFKILLVRNHWTDFNITLQKCFFGDPLPRFFKPFVFVKKTWPPGGGAYFPYVSSI